MYCGKIESEREDLQLFNCRLQTNFLSILTGQVLSLFPSSFSFHFIFFITLIFKVLGCLCSSFAEFCKVSFPLLVSLDVIHKDLIIALHIPRD